MTSTRTEQLLTDLCQKSFMRIWSYAHPFKDDGHEFCDIVCVFETHVFIFFDREKILTGFAYDEDPQVRWQRWKRDAVDRQIQTAHGAERYLLSGRPIYLDAKATKLLPLPLSLDGLTIHKIVVAHGAAEACKRFSEENIFGSLAIIYEDLNVLFDEVTPFFVRLDKQKPVHLFDTDNIEIILGELDTVKDFSDYLDEKLRAIRRLDLLTYCGEEDLLAHYWLNKRDKEARHVIGPADDSITGFAVEEGCWKRLTLTGVYTTTKKGNKISYLWDQLINRACDLWLGGHLRGETHLSLERNPISEMAKEPRFMRRELCRHIQESIQNFEPGEFSSRHVRFFESFYKDVGYVFLQLHLVATDRGHDTEYIIRRQNVLQLACGSAKTRFPNLKTIIGIATESPKSFYQAGAEFLLLDCSSWTEKDQEEIAEVNLKWGFFATGTIHQRKYSEFLFADKTDFDHSKKRPGRNHPCPCGSKKKFKHCHGSIVSQLT